MTYFIAYITATARDTVLVEQSRSYDSLARIKNHLRNTGFVYDEDLQVYINLETFEAAHVYLEGAREPQSVKRKLVKCNGRARQIVKVTVNL